MPEQIRAAEFVRTVCLQLCMICRVLNFEHFISSFVSDLHLNGNVFSKVGGGAKYNTTF